MDSGAARNQRFQPKLTVGQTTPTTHSKVERCPKIETSGRANIRVRGKSQRISGRRERGKVVERFSVQTKTYHGRHIQNIETGDKLQIH